MKLFVEELDLFISNLIENKQDKPDDDIPLGKSVSVNGYQEKFKSGKEVSPSFAKQKKLFHLPTSFDKPNTAVAVTPNQLLRDRQGEPDKIGGFKRVRPFDPNAVPNIHGDKFHPAPANKEVTHNIIKRSQGTGANRIARQTVSKELDKSPKEKTKTLKFISAQAPAETVRKTISKVSNATLKAKQIRADMEQNPRKKEILTAHASIPKAHRLQPVAGFKKVK